MGGTTKDFQLSPGKSDNVIRIGRNPKGDIVFNLSGVSWNHLELKPFAAKDVGSGAPVQLAVRDTSSNGTGLQLKGEELQRVQKGMDLPITDGAVIVLPMTVKDEKDAGPVEAQRASFSILLHEPPGKLADFDAASEVEGEHKKRKKADQKDHAKRRRKEDVSPPAAKSSKDR